MRRGNCALLAGVLLVGGAQANILIDDFTTGFASQSSSSGIFYNTASANSLGGFRFVNHLFGANPLNRTILTDVNSVVPGNMFIEAGSGVNGQATLAWAGSSTPLSGSGNLTINDFTGLGSVDFSSELGIQVDYINNDQASTALFVQVFDNSNLSSQSLVQTAAVGNGSLFFDFASFTGSANLADIKAVVMGVGLPNGNDITLTRVEAVPEPATMAVLGFGLAALAARKRRKA